MLARAATAYGPLGHEIVGAVADRKLSGTQTGTKLSALLGEMTLQRAANVPDEIKAWDKKSAEDLNAYPHYPKWPQIEQQLREFWKANRPGRQANDEAPSHHWFHYTDVPVFLAAKYADGKAGRAKWDVVHAISYCVSVLRGEIAEDNPRKITKPLAVILLAHFVGDIHQPLHVGAEYFSPDGKPADPDRRSDALGNEGGNSLAFIENATAKYPRHFYRSFHGYWDADAVRNLVIGTPDELPKEQRAAVYTPAKEKIIVEFAQTEPNGWRTSGPPQNAAEQWANEILPVGGEAYKRVRFERVHREEKDGRVFAAGEAIEVGAGYRDWATGVVKTELHKAGWRLADLLEKTLSNQATITSAPQESAPSPSPRAVVATPAAAIAATRYGAFPADYQKIIRDWLAAREPRLSAEAIEWQTEPKPSAMPDARGREVYGYLVVFNSPARNGAPRSHGVLIHDGKVIVAMGFE